MSVITQLRKEQQQRNALQVKKFNDAWNIQQTAEPETLVSVAAEEPTDRPSFVTGAPKQIQHVEHAFVRDERPGPSKTLGTYSQYSGSLPAANNIECRTGTQKGTQAGEMDSEMYSRAVATSLTTTRNVSEKRERSRERSRTRHSRRYSRSRSRSPPRRRRRRSPARSRRRSRSYSRSRSSSRNSERSHSQSSRDSRDGSRQRSRTRRSRRTDETTMIKTMVATIMQVMNPTLALVNNASISSTTKEAHIQHLTSNRTLPKTLTPNRTPPEIISMDSSVQLAEDVCSKYDVSTELFLEGKLNFSDFLALKPSSAQQSTSIIPNVSKRINEAILVLQEQDAKKPSARFLYVPPTYYDEKKNEEIHRSPLIWNSENVLYSFTSHSKEVQRCQPFRNVNSKLKDMIYKLGLDEGVLSQQLEQIVYRTAANDGANTSRGSFSRIQAITTLPPKPGSKKVRHMIERAVQTEGYACMGCIAKAKKTFVSRITQTRPSPARTDANVQTDGLPPTAPFISLEHFTPLQAETIQVIVHFIRARQLSGSLESIEHALRWDPTATTIMSPVIQQNAQKLLAQVRTQQHQAYGSTPMARLPVLDPQPPQQYAIQRDPRMNSMSSAIRSSSANSAQVIVPACFTNPQPVSKHAKKKLKEKQKQHHW
ncbi:uncharacterized protein LOC128722408 [Anopheles nili]|uniref:uncharacterized protein LOC128722408 n=1 Tax=Anopheles nili TaxID=185578 RepID=UPI00237C2C1E|nr:uncharacterized protein LOC128722408 [Anopheles nili]